MPAFWFRDGASNRRPRLACARRSTTAEVLEEPCTEVGACDGVDQAPISAKDFPAR